jgi:N-acetylneuraminate lyase
MKKKIEGFIAATLTDYYPDGSVKMETIPHYAAMLYKNGVVGVFVNGTAGEGATLTFDERLVLAEYWAKSVPEDLRVIIHVGYARQEESRAMAIHAAKIGVHGIGEIGPVSGNITSVEKLAEYTAATASAAPELPYYYYHIPSINNLNFPMIEYLTIAEAIIPNLAGIKFTHDNISDYQRCIEFKNSKYDILFGRDEFLLEGLKAGASGAVGSTYNIMVPLYQALVNAYRSGDFENAVELQAISAEVCRILYETGSFGSGLKAIVRKTGVIINGMRYPGKDLIPKFVRHLEKALEKTGMFTYLNKT